MKPRKRERDIRPGDDLLEWDGKGYVYSIRLDDSEWDLQYAIRRVRKHRARVVRTFRDRVEFVA